MKIFIGCSASKDISNIYFEKIEILLNKILKENDLVFGACNSGLMEISHKIAKKNNREIIGVCPKRYKDDFKDLSCNTEIITKNITERIDKLIIESDLLLFLPGGIGTINELFTAIECKRCHEFDKPIVIYNLNGFYDKILEFLDKIYEEKFARIIDKELYFISSNEKEIIKYIKNNKR